jgi:hypothetical protein
MAPGGLIIQGHPRYFWNSVLPEFRSIKFSLVVNVAATKMLGGA